MPDVDQLAAALVETTANLAAYIERRAEEIAGPRIDEAMTAAQQRVDRMVTALDELRQRNGDLIAELRRQLNAQVKQNERLHREAKDLRAAVRRVLAAVPRPGSGRCRAAVCSRLQTERPDMSDPRDVVIEPPLDRVVTAAERDAGWNRILAGDTQDATLSGPLYPDTMGYLFGKIFNPELPTRPPYSHDFSRDFSDTG